MLLLASDALFSSQYSTACAADTAPKKLSSSSIQQITTTTVLQIEIYSTHRILVVVLLVAGLGQFGGPPLFFHGLSPPLEACQVRLGHARDRFDPTQLWDERVFQSQNPVKQL